MKKILVIALCAMFAVSASAQRFGTTPGKDNTGRTFTFAKVAKNDAAGNDTLTLAPNASQTIVTSTLTDSVSFTPNTSYSYLGDEVVFMFTNSSGAHKVKFIGTNWAVDVSETSTLTVASSGIATIVFKYNGTKWCEVSRSY